MNASLSTRGNRLLRGDTDLDNEKNYIGLKERVISALNENDDNIERRFKALLRDESFIMQYNQLLHDDTFLKPYHTFNPYSTFENEFDALEYDDDIRTRHILGKRKFPNRPKNYRKSKEYTSMWIIKFFKKMDSKFESEVLRSLKFRNNHHITKRKGVLMAIYYWIKIRKCDRTRNIKHNVSQKCMIN
ncbi:Plasmodium exported protein, unknown function [Plasmodium ovale wallikeri]|uniref:Uncharacterized protein n=1 Tax=Plasmodium ovale wallikeri TaxID=864142 RepID=A0A1A9AFS7_PLAOA|nr:Plasmodium exported protein, unknown function [Plasmodium ovale wallikeri]SBT55402.1 Plasmodium exported protein, unknown function [Plasmodium ovale wallikeri]